MLACEDGVIINIYNKLYLTLCCLHNNFIFRLLEQDDDIKSRAAERESEDFAD